MSYTVAGLINAADVCEEVKREDERPLADPEQLRAHAALIEENARLKRHAEAMANELEPFTRTVMGMPAGKAKSLEAYRAAYPKDAR